MQLPPLRERQDRGELLCNMVAHELPGCDPRQVLAQVWSLLMAHTWPGNLRQMRAVVRYACAVMEGPRMLRSDLPLDVLEQCQAPAALPANITPIRRAAPSGDERSDVLHALQSCHWNMSAAARALGICRPSLYRVMRRLDIPPLKEQLALGACGTA